MIKLSYSTINNCLQPTNSHNWLNKMMGLKPEERPEWKAGKEAHTLITEHISGKKPSLFLKHITLKFPVVEERDFDERCKFDFKLTDKYNLIGFYDGIDIKNGKILEIKSGDPVWSVSKFVGSMQRKLYALSNPKLTEAVLITCSKNPAKWENEPPKVYSVPLTKKDRAEAHDWILTAIEALESGKFAGGLDENGKCIDRWCYFGSNCQFK